MGLCASDLILLSLQQFKFYDHLEEKVEIMSQHDYDAKLKLTVMEQ